MSGGPGRGRKERPAIPRAYSLWPSEYGSWAMMKQRCLNPNSKNFKHWGGRGVEVCAHWRDFLCFLADMGPKPSPKHSIDRIDVNGNYTPANCRWATPSEQRRNQRKREAA